ncbi:MAG: hypothetical protein U0835_24700 [Isosphaeraceae bacterium]
MVTVGVSNMTLAASTTAGFGPGVTVLDLEIVNATTAGVRLALAAGAALGARNVTATSLGRRPPRSPADSGSRPGRRPLADADVRHPRLGPSKTHR